MNQPNSSQDRFAILGLPRRFDLDVDDLDRRYREASRKVHPDRFATAPARERMESLVASTALNDAYRTLKDPVRRAGYLLELGGHKLGENDRVEPDFLMDIMELRESLSEAKSGHETARLAVLEQDVRGRAEHAIEQVGQLFAAGGDLATIKQQLLELRYFQRFLDELEAGAE